MEPVRGAELFTPLLTCSEPAAIFIFMHCGKLFKTFSKNWDGLIAAYVLVRKQVPAGLTQADLVLTTWRLEASPDQGPAAARLTAVSRPGSALGWSHEGSDR